LEAYLKILHFNHVKWFDVIYSPKIQSSCYKLCMWKQIEHFVWDQDMKPFCLLFNIVEKRSILNHYKIMCTFVVLHFWMNGSNFCLLDINFLNLKKYLQRTLKLSHINWNNIEMGDLIVGLIYLGNITRSQLVNFANWEKIIHYLNIK
jgi:hypothetical protein